MAGFAASTVAAGRKTTRRGPRYSVSGHRMRHAFDHEVDVITDGTIPVRAVRQTVHPRAEYVGVVPGTTLSRSEYVEFLSVLREILYDRSLSLVDGGFSVTGPITSEATWVLCGTLPDSTRLYLPAAGKHRWARNGKCIRAEVTWLDAAATSAFVSEIAERASSLPTPSPIA